MIFTEGCEDCVWHNGVVGVVLHKGQTYGVMHCAWHEYQNAAYGAKSKIGGILTERCNGCCHYQKRKKEQNA